MSSWSRIRSTVFSTLSFSIGLSLATAATPSHAEETATSPGEALYQGRCATCHEGRVERAPDRNALRQLSPDRIGFALAYGMMSQQVRDLSSRPDRRHRAVPGGRFSGAASGAGGFELPRAGSCAERNVPAALERLGCRHPPASLPACRPGPTCAGRCSAPEVEMVVRIPERRQGLRAADRFWRLDVRWQCRRQGLCA